MIRDQFIEYEYDFASSRGSDQREVPVTRTLFNQANNVDLTSEHPFWSLKNGLIATFPPLDDDVDCEVVVVGAGITGALLTKQLSLWASVAMAFLLAPSPQKLSPIN